VIVFSRPFASCLSLAIAGALAMPSIATAGTANPYSFYGSVAECAAAEQQRCEACVPSGSCSPITEHGDGNLECAELGAERANRGYSLMCINLALAIDSISTCSAQSAPGCARYTHASDSLATLDNNAEFLDNPTCSGPLDTCLAAVYGPSASGTVGTTPRDTSIDCSDTSCDSDIGCDDGSCDDSGGSCDDSGGDSGGSCDGGDSGGSCGGGDSGGSCDGGDCSGDGGSSCSDGGGDCSGGGGDCSGGGSDCSAGKHHDHGGGLAVGLAWAFLPLPFASLVKRRARRRR
jgi:hypothetical protein